MILKEVSATIKNKGSKMEWREILEVPENCECEFEEVKKIIKRFNRSLKPGKVPRKVVRVRGNLNNIQKQRHSWDKVSLVSEKGGYDQMKCDLCGITAKRHGMSTIIIDAKYKTADQNYCKL